MGLTSKQRGRVRFTGGVEVACRAYLVDGAIAANLSHNAVLTKAGVGAYTLAAPARNGIRLTIVNTTANAHVVTSTNLVDDGVTGGAKDTMTFGAFAGAAIELLSYGGTWNVVNKNVVTVAAV